jgi:outer membrane protein OmpA-like peptidoglycan-associated protein
MNCKQTLFVIIASILQSLVFGQSETYSIRKTSFSSDKYDEFSPVFWKNGIVFTTNRSLGLVNYSTSQNKGLLKINFIDTTGDLSWKNARLFSKGLTTKFNDGPVTFNSRRDTIYYSRNLEVSTIMHDISIPRSKLGVFYAILDGNYWTKIREFRINSEWFNVTTPCLSPDSKKIYFASDKPGGFGGSDLYYCQWQDGYWNDPVNLGPNINTKGNEAYPFITPSGELLFSSDGLPGFGGKDIFFSRFSDTAWMIPVHLDAPVNSEKDDFGIITDTLMNTGYFSSNRDGSLDIFYFRTNSPQIFYNSVQRENQYCFTFSDSGAILIDTLNLKYVWDFGDGKKASAMVAKHCYPGTGKYTVKLDIVDKASGNLFFSKLAYNVEIKDFEQPYINSPDVLVIEGSADFDGLKSYLPGYRIQDYYWDFGDGSRAQGARVKHSFKEKGMYLVNLGLTIRNISTNSILRTGTSKKIFVAKDPDEMSLYLTEKSSSQPDIPDIRKFGMASIRPLYSAETEYKQDAVFQVEAITSKTKIDLKSNLLSFVPKKYEVSEIFDRDSGIYRYVIDQQMSLMASYIAYREMVSIGYKDAKTVIEILKDPVTKELNSVKKIYGTLTDSYFDSNNRLTSSAYLFIDQIVKILNRYSGLNLEIIVHTDNTGSSEDKLILSQTRAQAIANYMINRGISSKRLIAKGLGGSRPIAPNLQESERKLNRRIDLRIVNQ